MSFLKYFLYLAWNWNLRLALFVTRHEVRGEKKYRQKTIGIDDLTTHISSGDLLHASIYQPVNYYIAEQLFDQTYLHDVERGLLDLGCGKGRVFAIAAAYGYKHIVGVDLSEQLCRDATRNAEELKTIHPNIHIEVVCTNASEYQIPATISTIFLFNPFDYSVMRSVIRNLEKSLEECPRPVKILYANPVCKRLFIEAGFTETFYSRKMTYLEASVLEK